MRVLLIDDHAIVREGLRALLEDEAEVEVVGEAASAADGLAAAERLKPDLVVTDLRMPGMPITEAIAQMRQRQPELKILVFTSFIEDPQALAALEAGAGGLLLKDARGDEIRSALKAIAAGEAWLSPKMQRSVLDALRASRQEDPLKVLTVREREVLNLIGEALSNKEIGRRLNLTEGTVKGYVSTVLEKLGLADRTEAALLAVKQGLGKRT
jgi:DNA-binding NarL/FixJ family response regulator